MASTADDMTGAVVDNGMDDDEELRRAIELSLTGDGLEEGTEEIDILFEPEPESEPEPEPEEANHQIQPSHVLVPVDEGHAAVTDTTAEPMGEDPTTEIQIAKDERLERMGAKPKAEVAECQAAVFARSIVTWDVVAVREWMTIVLDLPELGAAAEGARVDGATAVEMDKDDWKELGATGLQAARLVGAVKKLG